MRGNVGRILAIFVLFSSSLALVSFSEDSEADFVEHIYYLHAESDTGIGSYWDLKLSSPEPNPTTVSIDVPNVGQFEMGEGWIQAENHDYPRNMSGTWTFTMYVYCDDDIITGRLYARVYSGFNILLNTAQNKSQPIGPCADPSSPKEMVWDDVLDHEDAWEFVQGERFRMEVWLDATSGGTTGTERMVTSEESPYCEIVYGSHLNTTAGNEGGNQYEQLREIKVPCGSSSIFEVVDEHRVNGTPISGDYTNLSANDGSFEIIEESGTPNSLSWIWNISISPGIGQYSFYLDAVIDTAPANDDDFVFEYSTTGAFAGEEKPLFTVNKTWYGSFSDPPPARFDFPAGDLSGVATVHIRARDTNNTDWPQLIDVLELDRMYIELVEPTTNCSAMDHIWVVDNLPPGSHRIYVNGYHSPSSDGDEFHFSFSSRGSLGPYEDLFDLTNTTDEDFYYFSPVPGPPEYETLWLRVEDTDRTQDPSPALDDLYIDHIYLNTTGGGIPYQLHLLVDNHTFPSSVRTVEDADADNVKPTSTVLPLPLYSDTNFEIEFLASDVGSGVNHVELWYILPDDIHVQYFGVFTTSPINFTAPGNGQYYFYTRAVDNALNYEDRPLFPDAMTIVDTIPPWVTEVRPSNSATGVLRTTELRIRFSESMDSGSVNSAFRLVEDGSGKTWTEVDGIIVWNHPANDTFRFILPDGETLKWGTEYTINLGAGARDRAGNHLQEPFQSTFETEHEFNPALLILIIVMAVVIMLVMIAYFAFFKKKPKEEEEKIQETVPVQPGEAVPPPFEAPPGPMTMPIPPPAPVEPMPVEVGTPQMWEPGTPVEEMWKEDRSKLSACINCGRFIPIESSFCPYCGVKIK